MAGNMMEMTESDHEEDEVFMGPITKRELLAPIKKKVQSHPKVHPVPISTPRVIDHINLVTPAKSTTTHDRPLDLSMKISDPEVIDLSSPVVSNTILVPDTPGCRVNNSTMFDVSDFMDESVMGVSVDNILVDLNRDIETEMENDMEELQNKKAIQNQSVTSIGNASQNQSLHLQSFFNNTQHNGTALEGVVINGSEKYNGTLAYNDGTPVINGNQTTDAKHNATTNGSYVLANRSMNASQASHILENQSMNASHVLNGTMNASHVLNGTMNASHIVNGTSVDTTQNNATRNYHNETTNQMNTSKNQSQNGLENATCNMTQRQSASMNGSELQNMNTTKNRSQNAIENTSMTQQRQSASFSMNGSVLDSTEEISMMTSRELSTEDSNPHQDVLSESFQYYTGEELNKENDLNQSNHLEQKRSPVSVKHESDADLNETFEKLSMSYSKSGHIQNVVAPYSAEDTLEEIDILESYGYKVKEKLIPTINILSATIIEEENADRKSNNFSDLINKLPNTSQLEKSIKEPSSSSPPSSAFLNDSLAQEKVEELMNKSVCEENNISAHEALNKEQNMSVVETLDTMNNQNMSVADIPDQDKSSNTQTEVLQSSNPVNGQSFVINQESHVEHTDQISGNTSIQAKLTNSALMKSTQLGEDEDAMAMETSKLGEDTNLETSIINKSAVNFDSCNVNQSAVNVDTSNVNQSAVNVNSPMPIEPVVCESLSAVDVIGMDSCVGLCETINDIQEKSIVSPLPCLEFNDEPDDLNRSIIDNSDATYHWKEVNSAHNTYVDLSPIKRNASGETDGGFDFSTAATLGSDHTYAHGDPCSSQFSHMITRSEPSSSNSDDEIVQDILFVNMTNKKLLSIREENECIEKEENDESGKNGGNDKRYIEQKEQEMDKSDSETDEIVVQEVVDVGIEDEDMEKSKDMVENSEDDNVGINEPVEIISIEIQGENLNATFAKENDEEELNVSEMQEETSTYESAIKDDDDDDMSTLEKSMAEVIITKDWKETSLEGDIKEFNISKGVVIDENKEIHLIKNSTEDVTEKVDISNAVENLPIEKSLLAESVKKANEQMQELNAELNENQNNITENIDQNLSVHHKSVDNVIDIVNKPIAEASHEEVKINKTIEKDTAEGNSDKMYEVTRQVDEGKETDSEEIGQRTNSDVTGVDESIQPSVNEKSAIIGALGDKTEETDHCNNTHLANKVTDEFDFKSVVQKYEETTGASLSITNSELSFAPEFSKPRHINDDLNTSSPDLESSRKDTKKSTIKPSQIPMCRRANVLRPTKFTAGDGIKMPTKPLAKVKSTEKAAVNGTSNTSQREVQAKKPDSKNSTPTPVTPRSISRTLMSSFSSLANRITGRTPRKDVTTTSKLKSPEPQKPNALKSPKPVMSGLKAAKPTKSGGTSGIKSPNSNLKPSSTSDKAFSPIMARFRNVPSSTPAVKNISKTPTPRQKVNKTPGIDDSMGKQDGIRKSLSASKIEGQHKTLNKSSGFDSSLNNRKLDFKNVESKIGSIRKPDEISALQKAVKSPTNTTATTKMSFIKPPKFTASKLPSLAPTSLPTKRPSKFLNVQSPIGAYIRDGTKATSQDNKRADSSFIPRKLQKLNSAEGQSSTAQPKVKSLAEMNKTETGGNSVPASADVSMTDTPVISVQEMQHTAL